MNKHRTNRRSKYLYLFSLFLTLALLSAGLNGSLSSVGASAPFNPQVHSADVPAPIPTQQSNPVPGKGSPSQPPSNDGPSRPDWGGCSTTGFLDVNPGDYYYDPVEFLCERTAVYGSGSYFSPYNDARRDDMVRAVIQGENWPWVADPPTPTFADVRLDGYMSRMIQTAVSRGMVNGYPGDPSHYNPCISAYETGGYQYFRGCESLTRGQATKIMTAADHWILVNPANATYTDTPPTDTFYKYVETATSYGLVNGYSMNPPCTTGLFPCFRTYDTVKRGQMAKMAYLLAEGSLQHSDKYDGTNNWDHNAGATMSPQGFLQASNPSTNVYQDSAKSLQWTSTALTWMQDPSRNAGVDMVFHVFLANTNTCGSAHIVSGSASNNFSAGITPQTKSACGGGPNDQEIRFRVAAPNITANNSSYFGTIQYIDTVAEKSEVDIANYYEGLFDVHKDNQSKSCFYNNTIGYVNNSGNCHQ